jgi:hypothetical protein
MRAVALRISGSFLLLGAVAFSLADGQNPVVGKFSAARNAQISRGPATADNVFLDAKIGQAVREGFAVRTYRRSFAEITFNDRSALRVNEQTDLVVQSAQTLRRIRLDRGEVWVKDEHGSRTAIQTPVATATARGTEFTVSSDGTVKVKEGEVDLEAGGVVVTIGAGEIGGIGPGGSPEKLGGGTGPAGGNKGGNDNNWYEKPQTLAPTLDLGGIAAAGAFGLNIGGGGRGPKNPGAVPEPATMAALGMGAAGLIARKYRSKR